MLKSKKLCLHHLDIPLVIPKSSKTKCLHKKCGYAAKYTLRDFSIISPFGPDHLGYSYFIEEYKTKNRDFDFHENSRILHTL